MYGPVCKYKKDVVGLFMGGLGLFGDFNCAFYYASEEGWAAEGKGAKGLGVGGHYAWQTLDLRIRKISI